MPLRTSENHPVESTPDDPKLKHELALQLDSRCAAATSIANTHRRGTWDMTACAMRDGQPAGYVVLQEKGNANAHWWGKRCLAALDSSRGGPWEKIGLRQLSGMLVLVFARQVCTPPPSLQPVNFPCRRQRSMLSVGRRLSWEKVGLRQLSGMLVLVFERQVCNPFQS